MDLPSLFSQYLRLRRLVIAFGLAAWCSSPILLAVNVSGPLSGKVVWDTTGSPYLVTGDIIVETGDTLVIEPGVTVQFDSVSDDQSFGQDTSRAEIWVSGGHLIALGTAADSIVFTSNASTPAVNDWGSIYLGTGATARIGFCRFEYSRYAVYGSNTQTDSVVVRHCRIGNMERGLLVYGNDPGCTWVVDSNWVFKPTSHGIYLESSGNVRISNNWIDTTGGHGIYIQYANGTDSTIQVIDNTLAGSGNNRGIFCNYSRPVIRNNGVNTYFYGIFCYESGSEVNQDVSFNRVVGGNTGIYLSGDASPRIQYNNLYGQSAYQLYNDTDREIDARFNWWGGPATDSMEAGGNPKDLAGIYDYFDNALYGEVIYFAWLDTVDGSPTDSACWGVLELVNGSGGIQRCFQPGETVYVRLTDADQDTDQTTTDTVAVYIQSATETVPETVNLVETDTSTGVFEGFILLDSAGTPVPDGLVQAVYGDPLSAEYHDPRNGMGRPDTMRAAGTFVVTKVSGPVLGAVTWEENASPFLVTGDIVIDTGGTLFIDPGVEVFFEPGSDDQATGSNDSLCEIYVNGGCLYAQGTAADSVLFTSNAPMPNPGDWQALFVTNGDQVKLDHCRIEYACHGVYGYTTSWDSITVRHTAIESVETYGIYVSNNTGSGIWVIDSCQITTTGSDGICLYACFNTTVSHTRIEGTAGHGIHTRYPNDADSTTFIINNQLTGTDTNNGIFSNDCRPVVTGNTINNYGNGLACYLGTIPANPAQALTGNTITGGSTGVYIAGNAVPTLRYNNIFDQSGYQVYNQTDNTIQARNNYWGPAATAEMETGNNPKNITGIYDQFDDGDCGYVNYSAWLDTADGTPKDSNWTGNLALVNGTGEEQHGYPVGDSVFVNLTDPDENQDTAAVETVRVLLTSDTETEAETLRLAETGSNSGIFSGFIELDSSSFPTADGKVQAVKEDFLYAEYYDQVNDFAEADTNRVAARFGVLLVTGDISGKQVWTKTSSPYLVTGDIIVGAGDTLQLEPGVKVFFLARADDQAAGANTRLGEIYMDSGGVLLAQGTAIDSIIFVSNSPFPAPGDWQGISFNSGGSGRLDYCQVKNVVSGVYGNFTNTDTIIIRQSWIGDADYGLYINWNGPGCTWLVDSNHVERISNHGVYLDYSLNTTISHNRINSGGGSGVYIQNYQDGNDSSLAVLDNSILGSGGNYGVYALRQRPALQGNTIDNFNYGIWCQVDNNDPNRQEITFNTIKNGHYGIYLGQYVEPLIRYNSIYGQSSYQVYNQSFRDINAQYNYWGPAATAQMDSGGNPKNIIGIYDAYENGTYGTVDYANWRYYPVPGAHAPVISSGMTDTATEDLPFSYVAQATHRDSGTVPTITFGNYPSWLSVIGDTIGGTPVEGNGDTSFTVIATDGQLTDTLSVELTVVPVNDAPVLTSATADTAREDTLYTYTALALDEEGDSVRYAFILPSWLAAAGSTATGMPLHGMADTVLVVIVSDQNQADTQTVWLTVIQVNDAPMVISALQDTATEDIPYTYTAQGTDEEEDPLTITFADLPGWLTVSGDTVFGTPPEGAGDTVFTVMVSDSEHTDTGVVALTVMAINDPPVITSGTADTATEGILFIYIATAADPDGTPTISFEDFPAWLSVAGDTISGVADDPVADTFFTVIADDGTLADTLLVSLTVLAVNDMPQVTSAALDTAIEEQAFSYVARATDPDDVPVITFINYPSWLTVSGDTIAGTPDDPIADTGFLIIADDGTLADTLTVSLTVVPVNDAPQVASAAMDTATEEQPFTYVAFAADPDNMPVINFINYPSWLTVSGDTIAGTPDDPIADTGFLVIADDGTLADTLTVSLTVVPVNDRPIITSAASDTAMEKQPYVYVATAVDPDHTPAISFEDYPAWLTVTGDTISGTAMDLTADTFFTVIADDGTLADTLVVSLVVIPFNDAPVITSAALDTAIEEQAFFYVALVTDPDDIPIISFIDYPSWLAVSGDTIAGVPDDPVADTVFTIIADDGKQSDTVIVGLTIIPVNDAPQVTSAALDTAIEEQAFISVAKARDPDDVPAISFINYPSWLTVRGDTIAGIPDDPITDTCFTIIAGDGDLADTLTVSLMVVPINDPPIITSAGSDTATEEQPYIYIASADDPDDFPTISFEGFPSWLAVSGDTIRGMPDDPITDVVFIVIADDGTITDTLTVNLAVEPINDAPIITSATADTAAEGHLFVYVACAIDPDNAPVISYHDYPSWLAVSGDTIAGIPDDPITDISFRIMATDGSLTDTLVVTVTVQDSNEAPAITSVPADTAAGDSLYEYIATGIDPEGDPIQFSFAWWPGWLSRQGDTLRGTVPARAPDTLFRVIATDGYLNDTLDVQLVISWHNTPPVIVSPPTDTAYDDTLYRYVARAADNEDPLVITFADVPSWLTVSGDTIQGVATDGTADTSFIVIASDGLDADTLIVILTVLTGTHVPPNPFIEQAAISLTQVNDCAFAWGDYDKDGDLDLALTGSFWDQSAAIFKDTVELYRNDGSGGLHRAAGVAFRPVDDGAVAWGDYNNDGWVDLFLTGYNSMTTKYVASLYSNNRDGTFSELTGAAFTGVRWGTVDWVDYGLDGDQDIYLTGYSGAGYVGTLYRNNGDSTFRVVTGSGLAAVRDGATDWADYDRDGDPDLLVTGFGQAGAFTGELTRVYTNNGDGTFAENTSVAATGLCYSAAAWGDYDNDGYADFAVTGADAGSNPQVYLYHNNGDHTFTEVGGTGFNPVDHGALTWIDYDNNGWLDLILNGDANGSASGGEISRVYRNQGDGTFAEQAQIVLAPVKYSGLAGADFNGDGTQDILLGGWGTAWELTKLYSNVSLPNTTPTVPMGTAVQVNGYDAVLSWNASTDVQNPAPTLTYNLMVGSAPGGFDIVNPLADASGSRYITGPGNVGHDTSFTLSDLAVGTYYWRVQTVDPGDAASAFSAEGSFTVSDTVGITVTQAGLWKAGLLRYENPVRRMLRLTAATGITGRFTLYLADPQGRVLGTIRHAGGVFEHTLDLADLKPGTYYLQVVGSSFTEVHKVVIY